MQYGSGEFTYEYVPGWAKVPSDWKWSAHTCGIAVDAQDNVFCFNRTEHPLIVFDPSGNVLKTWGEGVFERPHGIFIAPDGMVYCSDDLLHVIMKFTPDGTLLQTIGNRNQPSDSGHVLAGPLMQRLNSIKRGAGPFNRPTRLVVAPWGEMYASDGYGNARIHRFTAEGQLINSWGEPGHGPSEFFLPHSVAIDGRDRVLVADRENHRVQLFSRSGEFLEEWADIPGAADISIDKAGRIYIIHRPMSVSIKDLDGNTLGSFAAGDVLLGSHSICVDSAGNIYAGHRAANEGEPETPTIHKFALVS